jgi:glycosyltransferase involved in cell wall biosynthesis
VIIPRRHWLPADWEKGRLWFQALHRAGIAVIYEVDDDMFSDDFVRRLIVTHGKAPEKAEEVRRCVLHTLKQADGVTVSSQRLATIVRRLTDKPVVSVANYIDLDWFTAVQRESRRAVPGLTIGWAGGARPDSDVAQMAMAWGRIARRWPDVTFVVQGHQAQTIYDHVPHNRIAAVDWLPIDQYPAGMVNIDIGCCPLGDSPFNRAKTYIKALEYAAGGAAVVASPTVYGQIIENGRDGCICRTADEWQAALEQLVASANRRKRLAQQLLAKVEAQHSLAGNAWRWPVAWGEIVTDFRRRNAARQIATAPARRMRVQV